MKTLKLSIAFILLSIISYSNDEKVVTSKIDNVTIFPNSAQIFRSGQFSIKPGVSDIIFEGVSPQVSSRSIQAKGMGDFVIMDVQFRVKQPEPILPVTNEIPPKIIRDIELTEDSLAFVNFELEDFKKRTEVLSTEKTLLMNNKLVQGNSDTIPEIKEALAYLRTQLLDINKQLMTIMKEEYKVKKNQARMQKRLNELRNYNSKVTKPVIESPKYQIVVTVSAQQAVNGKIDVNYTVSSAGWSPTYDIRAESIDKGVKLIYKANVFQNSGEDWSNVNLKLSTINPSQSIYKPALPVYYLNFYNPAAYNQKIAYGADKSRREVQYARPESAMGGAVDELELDLSYNSPAVSSAVYTQTVQTLTNIEYDIPLQYSIPSDGQYHMVAVKNHELKTEYFHYLVPRIDKEAYLVAKVTDFQDLDLLTASANIYFNGTYIGETTINTNIMSDTIELALGKDRNIIAERKKESDTSKNKELIGSNLIRKIDYQIKIKNNKSNTINLIVEDQIPIAQTAEIKIEKIETSGADYNEKNGMLVWRSKLSGKSVKTLEFSYSIEHDKDMQLANLN